MDPTAFERLLANAEAASPQDQPAADAPEATPSVPDVQPDTSVTQPASSPQPGGQLSADEQNAAIMRGDATGPFPEAGLGDPSSFTEAALGGAVKSAFETKDFLFGTTAEAERSDFRKAVEDRTEQLASGSILDGFAAGVGQFATAMFGLGKFAKLAKGIPAVAGAVEGLAGVKGGSAALEVGKAATAGAIAFDPHEARLSNLIQDTPLANPLNAFLAADPGDSALEGRAKAAMESIGLDAAIIGTFFAGARALKALRNGDTEAADAAIRAHEAEVENATAGHPGDTGSDALSADLRGAAAGDLRGGDGDTLAGGHAPVAPEVSVTSNPTDAAAAAGVDLKSNPLPSAKPAIKLTHEDTTSILDGMAADAEAMADAGGWYQAIQAGHTFGKGEGIPYVKLNAPQEVDDFMARVVDATAERLDKVKGGAVLSDAKVTKMLEQRATLMNEDPAQLIGMVQQSGKNANRMVADMEAGYLVANRMFQDSYALAARIQMGDFAEFGSKDAAEEALRHRLSLATSVYGSARSITAQAGRAVRRMRSDFRLSPEDVANLKALPGDALAELLVSTGGDPRQIAKVANPSIWRKALDVGQYLFVNNLVSGPKTHLINAVTNAYMVGVRPVERMLGSVVMEATGKATPRSRALLAENVKQYVYMRAAFTDAFEMAKKAFLRNDSYLAPHKVEFYNANQGAVEANAAGSSFKPWTSLGNVFHNALTAIGLPTRTLGATDELVKQLVYRSKVMAAAHMEGVTLAQEKGLDGKAAEAFVKSYVTDSVVNAFDTEGRAINAAALREAQVATFQQDLLPSTFGKGIQNLTAAVPPLKFVLPFVKTPTNVIRTGIKMTPGLNLVQDEYRRMLRGEMGAEAQAQAYGQMSMGTLLMGTCAFAAAEGRITGGGPADYKQLSELQNTGWQPYSIVLVNDDGSKTYVPYGRYDPLAVPLGICADVMDTIHNLDLSESDSLPADVEAVVGALGFALARQIPNKSYLTGLSQALDAINEPSPEAGKLSHWINQTAANLIPYSAAMRQLNPDPYLREARDLTDRMRATVPGLSASVPPKYDAFGRPMLARKGLWSSDTDQALDREVQRLGLEGGSTLTRPTPYHSGVDLRDVTLSDGKNAYAEYQRLAGNPPGAEPLADVVSKFIQTDAYRRAPDGDTGTRGTKLWLLHNFTSRYREAAFKRLKADPVVRDAILKKQRDVAAAYAQQDGVVPAPRQTNPLQQLGDAFGVDLSPPQ